MPKRALGAVALLAIAGTQITAQQFPPGYVDPAPLLAAAAKEIGEANLRCVTFSGTGYGGAVGQTVENAVNIDWPRIDSLANYTRTINWDTATSIETFDRKPGLNPASWKYGLGWQDGTPRSPPHDKRTSSAAATPGTWTALARPPRFLPSLPSCTSSISG